jgi:hypothetical protein
MICQRGPNGGRGGGWRGPDDSRGGGHGGPIDCGGMEAIEERVGARVVAK